MRGIFDNIIVKVPKQTGVFINWSDKNKVIYSQGSVRGKNGKPKRIGSKVIGYAVSDTEMHPNTNYRDCFPAEWKEATGEEASPDIRKFGMILTISTICENEHILRTLNKSIPEDFASAILDFAGYSIFFGNAAIEHFAASMQDQLLISTDSHDASYYDDLFKNQIKEEHAIAFRREWAEECLSQGDTDVWLCIESPMDEHESTGVEFVEQGFAAPDRNEPLVGYSFAVTEKGKPVTYEAYRGELIDRKTLESLIESVESYGFHIKGVILDRGYCNSNVIDYLRSKPILFIIALSRNVQAYKTIMEMDGNTLRLLPGDNQIEGTCLYGASEKLKLCKGSKEKDTVYLYYDTDNAFESIKAFLTKINKALMNIRKAISRNTSIPDIGKESRQYLEFVYPDDAGIEPSDNTPSEIDHSNSPSDREPDPASVPGENQIEESISPQEEKDAETKGDDPNGGAEEDKTNAADIHADKKRPIGVKAIREKIQEYTDTKGFLVIASSDSLSPGEVHLHYSHRDISETTYMIFRGQERFDEVLLHSGEEIQSKFLAAFVASIIRFYFEQSCSDLDIPTNELFRKLNLIRMKNSSGVYFYSDETDPLVKDFLNKISVKQGWSEKYIRSENRKLHGHPAPKTPRKSESKPESPHRLSDENGSETGRKPDPMSEPHHSEFKKDGSQRQKPGPKPGFRPGEFKKDGSKRQKPGPKPGSRYGEFKKDGSKRQKPGPKPGTKHRKQANDNTSETN